jgi:hypothetical protein
VGLDPQARLSRDQRWGDDGAFVSRSGELSLNAVTARSGLITEPQFSSGVPILSHVLPPSTQFEAATFTGRLPTTGPIEIAIADITSELIDLQALPLLTLASDIT